MSLNIISMNLMLTLGYTMTMEDFLLKAFVCIKYQII